MQNDVCEEFDTKMLFSHSSAERGEFLTAQLKSQFIDTYEMIEDIKPVWKPVVVQCAAYTSVMSQLEMSQ